MKSIRASLIVYFWLLLGLGLGTASVLAYGSAAASLREKQEVNRQLEEKQFEERQREVKARFDEHLHDEARFFASHVKTEVHRERSGFVQAVVVALAPLGAPQVQAFGLLSWSQMPLQRPQWPGSAFSSQAARRINVKIEVDETKLPPEDAESEVAEFFQVDSDSGAHWPPQPFGEKPRFGNAGFDPAKALGGDWVVDDVVLPNGQIGRHVQYKSPTTRVQFSFPRRPGGGRGSSPSNGDRPPSGGGDRPPFPAGDRNPPAGNASWIVVHCASETTLRDKEIDRYRSDLNAALDRAESDGQQALTDLRNRLIGIVSVSFLLTTIGAYILVGLGLVPLRRVTDAVSRVSPRDFRLPLPADEPLPRELAPIRDRLQETLDELRKAFEREKQAAADISHELRTPVASILTAVEVALRKPRSADEYRQTLEDCRAVARQMRQLVERLMALARLDAGSDKVRPRPVDVAELIRECTALVKPLAGERGLDVRVHCPKPVVWTTDPDKLREVLVNLLHNAVQYNRPGGSIDVSAQTADGWLDVQVHDTGAGIPADAFGHIFERFYRADPSRHASELHAGLGLSIVKGYVGLLGGTITVDSQVGQGSTFRVRLPKAA